MAMESVKSFRSMRFNVGASCFVAALMCLSGSAHAFLSTGDALDWLEGDALRKSSAEMYISGMAEAHFWHSILAARSGGGAICLPENQSLQTEELKFLAIHAIKKHLSQMRKGSEEEKRFLGEPLSASLIFALMKEYPCR